MGTQKRREPEPEITARPKTKAESVIARVVEEEGLSVGPEDLGRQFLAEATEQGNFESSMTPDTSEIAITGAAPTDDPIDTAEPGTVWTKTVDAALESGGLGPFDVSISSEQDYESAEDLEPSDDELQMIEDVVDEVSLFDMEAAEVGEVEPVHPDTEDTGKRMRRVARRRSARGA